jgi:site-specific DNA-methyltransferase (adenine-specific)
MILSETPRIELLNMDCMDFMRDVPDKYYELAIVDPPYGLGKSVVNSRGRFARYKNKNGNWDLNVPTSQYFDDLFRISDNQIICGGNYFLLPPNKSFVIWDKGQPEGISFAMCEYLWTSFNSVAQIFRSITQGQTQRSHPTAKPITLYLWLLHNYANPGDKILDTHLGSGSSAIAAYRMGFDFTGIELDKEYFDASVKRFKEQTAQVAIQFDKPNPEPKQLSLI